MSDNIPKEWKCGPGKECPACGYVRKIEDKVKSWECPQCGIIYAKYSENPPRPKSPDNHKERKKLSKSKLYVFEHIAWLVAARIIDILLLITLIIVILSFWQKNKLPDRKNIEQVVMQSPKQTKTNEKPFSFMYRGNRVDIQPLANYKLWGLIVSQNDVYDWVWGYDEDDVNIKDVCAIFGRNLGTSDYQHWTIYNKQWTCFINVSNDHPHFYGSSLSNNHLLSNKKWVRDKIRSLKVGDQFYMKGMLVSYRSVHSPNWRRSSLNRNDVGNGACEVFFVSDIEILKRGSPVAYFFFNLTFWLFIILIVSRITITLYYIFCVLDKTKHEWT